MKLTNALFRGFSYIELLITVIIFIVLILFAYPSYQSSILKVRRAEARSALHSVMLQQERYYTQHHTYASFETGKETTKFKWWSGDSVANSYYEISASSCASQPLTQCVLLTAASGTKNVKQVDDPVCGNLMLDSANNKTYSKGTTPNSECW